jgi:hypothetical protein
MALHFPPGTDRAVRKRADCWARYRINRGQPAPCWGFYLHAVETWPDRMIECRAKARSIGQRNAVKKRDKESGMEPKKHRDGSKALQRAANKIEEKMVPYQIMQRAKLTPAEVRAILDADRRRCA